MNYRYPVYQPSLNGNEKLYVNQCLDSTWISSKGTFIERFEKSFAEYTTITHAMTVSNGTVAMHLALLALDIGPGDEVIVPSFTYIASVNAIKYVGAIPVFADIEPNTWQLDVQQAASKITPRTKAIIAVHIYGAACDTPQLKTLCDQHGLFLIEDCAEAIGTKSGSHHAGTLGHIAAFSFFGNKTITTGEGGMVCTHDEILAKKVRHLKGQGLAANREYWHDIIGYNYRMTNICAAIGLAQLERVHEIIDQKRAIGKRYESNLINLPLTTQPEAMGTTHSFWMCSILLNDGTLRDALRLHLNESGIETRPFFYPVHLMPMYFENQQFPVTEDIASRGINIPSYPDLQPNDIDIISNTIQSFFL